MKPKVLIVSDSAYLDTGFGRVAREIGTGLVASGRYDVEQLGWFHHFAAGNDRFVPFRVWPTDLYAGSHGGVDAYGQITYPKVVERSRPDVVLYVGDEWMMKHAVARPRDHLFVAYVPIDSAPVMASWVDTFRAADHVVAYGNFGEAALRAAAPELSVMKIPHGVDTDAFRPLDDAARRAAKREVVGSDEKFVLGCVARNNARKNLPRLLKAFRQFLNPSTTCNKCGHVDFRVVERCPVCDAAPDTGGTFHRSAAKSDALLYLHTVMNDSAGHNLFHLINRFGVRDHVAWPANLQVGKGVPDAQLNDVYNAFDAFTLPTGGEGWGLPILEAMSAGLPTLVTEYSGHVEFVRNAGEFIRVAEYETCTSTHGERAIVDIHDYVCKLDRFYYEPDAFFAKWGPYMRSCGITDEQVANVPCGREVRRIMGADARARAETLTWEAVRGRWVSYLDNLCGDRRRSADCAESGLTVESV